MPCIIRKGCFANVGRDFIHDDMRAKEIFGGRDVTYFNMSQ